MKSILCFETAEECEKHAALIKRLMERLGEYEEVLRSSYQLEETPKAVMWTSTELATTVFSSIPIPAFTSEEFIYLSPELDQWRGLTLRQLDGIELPAIQAYYEGFGEDHLFEILAHELTHHIELFVDDFDDDREDSIWFEEGMCFYLPRLFLGEAYFNDITAVEQALMEAFQEQYGSHALDDFGAGAYEGSIPSIMFDYWRSYLKVKDVVDFHHGDVQKVFRLYHEWHESRNVQLSTYFDDISTTV
ncbi:hypothetical protein [Sporosarcina sp. Te-1]|uniref:hypothetical protein n=1 Tax=Sporosarcina sp. Te-1 TaxID=2818390 RepID=UPI001A9D9E44|nr:hypothetical protein [Sporosarcina sp. Te-1]QTD40337.1 hypothetical protein J3U78_16325 [Sporosarcina sp. Te-1]